MDAYILPQVDDMNITKTVRISERTNQRLAELAAALESDQSPLIDRLLTRALDAIDSGEWATTRTPVRYAISFDRPKSDRK